MRVLLLDNNPVVPATIQTQLSSFGHQVDAVENGQQGFMRATTNPYDIFICDILMIQ